MANAAVVQFELGSWKNFVYLILDPERKRAAWVDPQKDLEPPSRHLADHGFTLDWILLTHTHHDHVAGLDELARRYPAARIAFHELDEHRILGSSANWPGRVHRLKDGEKLALGALEVIAMHTPGHSAGEICFFVPSGPHLLTGDTLFIRDCGRTDFPDGSNEQMFASLQRIKKLPPETTIWPGHHYKPECHSTLRDELATSAPLQVASVAELAALP